MRQFRGAGTLSFSNGRSVVVEADISFTETAELKSGQGRMHGDELFVTCSQSVKADAMLTLASVAYPVIVSSFRGDNTGSFVTKGPPVYLPR